MGTDSFLFPSMAGDRFAKRTVRDHCEGDRGLALSPGLCVEHVRQLGGESPRPNLMEVKG